MKKVTIKEIRTWLKTLEENRYKKVYMADARRVAWLVNNNLSEDYSTMPKSIMKKWSKAQYGRERYLAKEYIQAHKQNEQFVNKLKGVIREEIQRLNEATDIYVIKYKKSKNRFLSNKARDVKNTKDALQFKSEKDARNTLNGLDWQFRGNYKIVKMNESINEYKSRMDTYSVKHISMKDRSKLANILIASMLNYELDNSKHTITFDINDPDIRKIDRKKIVRMLNINEIAKL